MAAVSQVGAGFALDASAGWPLLIRRIGRGGTIGIEGALLHAGFKLSDPRLQRLDPGFQWLDGRVLLLDDLHQLQDHLAHDEGVCSQLAASSGSPAGSGREVTMVSLIPHPHRL
jgi:hypothetical protein